MSVLSKKLRSSTVGASQDFMSNQERWQRQGGRADTSACVSRTVGDGTGPLGFPVLQSHTSQSVLLEYYEISQVKVQN